MFITDSCECGLGGFSIGTGRAFRYKTPENLRFRVSNNVLEFLAEVVAIWLGSLDSEVSSGSCAFSGTDNTSAVGWSFKSSFIDETQEPRVAASRELASLSIAHRFCNHTQHLKGLRNVVADCLSRDFHLDDKFLTHLLKFFYPKQLPPSFQIYLLPQEIAYFITGTLQASLVQPRSH